MGACYLPDKHVERIIHALVGHPALETFILTLNSCHERGMNAMAKLLQADRCRLRHLNLSHQKDEHQKVSMEAFSDALTTNQTLTHLKLSRNRLLSNDVQLLFEALQFNSTLCLLDMSNNCISDAGAQQIAAVLPNMPGLQKLYLLSNDIQSEASSLEFSRAMQINRQLQVLDIKQSLPHVPQIQYYGALNSGGRHLMATKKHVPLGLWPLILERAQKKNKDVQGEYGFVQDVLFYLLKGPALLENR
jgi:Ran GTPase-activating protein (RanGAP) involved in mRNA processing and transport